MNYKLIFVLSLVHFVSAYKMRSLNILDCLDDFCKDSGQKFGELVNQELIRSCPDCGNKKLNEINEEEKYEYLNCYLRNRCFLSNDSIKLYINHPVYKELADCQMKNCQLDFPGLFSKEQ